MFFDTNVVSAQTRHTLEASSYPWHLLDTYVVYNTN